jgi:ribonuclease P protein component
MENSNNYAKENISTEQSSPGEETRVSGADGDQERTGSFSPPAGERAQTSDTAPLLKINFGLPKSNRLRKPAEFRKVYANGRRFDGKFMSAFILANDLREHRLGITASRKGIGDSVKRNRAKRLLREAFRLSKIELSRLSGKYDFVLNARRALLKVKVQEPLRDFRHLVAFLKKSEPNADNDNLKMAK